MTDNSQPRFSDPATAATVAQRLSYLAGPLTPPGLLALILTCALDQASKVWLLHGFDLGHRDRVRLGPFLDLVLTRNKGISYGWFQQQGPLGQWALLILMALAVALLWIWLARARSHLVALALGLIMGGAIGNAIDRLVYGSVVDFVFFHVDAPTWRFAWYVFNLADVAIVAGVAGLLFDSVIGGRAAKAP